MIINPNNSMIMKRLFLISIALFLVLSANSQTSFSISKKRPAKLDLKEFNKIALGDFTDPSGEKSKHSLDLTDILTEKFLKLKDIEFIDKQTLSSIMNEQNNSSIKLIDENTVSSLSGKLSSALLISGRIQTDNVTQELVYDMSPISINGCNQIYYWKAKGNLTVNIKLIDIKSAKIIHSESISREIERKSNEVRCSTPEKMDLDKVYKELSIEVTSEIIKLLVNYQEPITISFKTEFFGNPFKEMKNAIYFFSAGEWSEGLEIMKAYTLDTKLKDKTKAKAFYNYGLVLLYNGQYEAAKSAFKSAMILAPNDADNSKGFEYIRAEKEFEEKLKTKN